MALKKFFDELKANFGDVVERNETVLVEHPGKQLIAIVAADKLASIVKTVHTSCPSGYSEQLLRTLEHSLGRRCGPNSK